MFEKLFGKKQPTQSQSISNVTVNGGQVQLGQAGQDLAQNQSGEISAQQQGLTGAEVVALLEQLRRAIEGADLTADQKEELLDYIKSAKREAGQAEPDKEAIGKNLRRVGETMKLLKETTEAGTSLWQTGAEILAKVAPWVGVAKAFLGL